MIKSTGNHWTEYWTREWPGLLSFLAADGVCTMVWKERNETKCRGLARCSCRSSGQRWWRGPGKGDKDTVWGFITERNLWLTVDAGGENKGWLKNQRFLRFLAWATKQILRLFLRQETLDMKQISGDGWGGGVPFWTLGGLAAIQVQISNIR